SDVSVTIDLSETGPQSWGDGTITLSDASGFENVFGSVHHDTIIGNSRNNGIVAGLGDDTVVAAGGDDTIQGNEGNDSLVGGSGSDTYEFDGDPQGNDVVVESADEDSDILSFVSAD